MIEDPVPIKVPPQLPVYHFQIAPKPNDPPFKPSVAEEPLNTAADGLTVIDVGEVDIELTVTKTV